MNLYDDTEVISIYFVLKAIMGCSGGKLVYIPPPPSPQASNNSYLKH